MPENINSEQKLSNIKQKAQKRKRLRATIIIAVIVLMIAIIVVGGYMLYTYKSYSNFTVVSETPLSGASDNLSYRSFDEGYLQCSNTGLIFFDPDGIIWDEPLSMARPLVDTCGKYAAVADMRQTDVYLYDRSGLAGRISSSHEIMDVEISDSGVIALATNDTDCSYIELKDIEGNDLINVKRVFSSSGYLADITLSPDGTRLAASFIYISQGSLESRVLFYDFSNESSDDMLVGGFSQYKDTIITDVEFLGSNVVCALGDNALTFYSFSTEPSIISEELDLEWEIQSVSFSSGRALITAKDPEGANNYRAYVYNSEGKQLASLGFDFAYSRAFLAGNNVLLYSSTDCQLISFKGLKRFSGTFGGRISYLLPITSSRYILATSEKVQFIRLK